jgi:hypothetical protein
MLMLFGTHDPFQKVEDFISTGVAKDGVPIVMLLNINKEKVIE